MSWFSDLVRDRILNWTVIGMSLLAGLVAAYGRERHQGKVPKRSWWEIRLYAMPFLAIITTAMVDQFKLNGSKTAFVAAMLAMMGYELIGMLHDRGLERAKKITDTLGGGVTESTAKPYHSVVDTDPVGRPAAHIVETRNEKPVTGAVGQSLREAVPLADLPDDMKPLLDALDNDMGDVPGIG